MEKWREQVKVLMNLESIGSSWGLESSGKVKVKVSGSESGGMEVEAEEKATRFSDFISGIISRRCKTRVGAWKKVGKEGD